MKYLLDTNTCIFVIKKKPQSVVRRLRSEKPEDVGISSVTVAELEFGVSKSQYPDRNRIALLQFLLPFGVLDFDQNAARHYGQIRAALEAAGTPIGPLDTLIGSQARAYGLVLVTNNRREFGRIEGLTVEDWLL